MATCRLRTSVPDVRPEADRIVVGATVALAVASWMIGQPGMAILAPTAAVLALVAIAVHLTALYRPGAPVAATAALGLAAVTAVASIAALVAMGTAWAADSSSWPRLVTIAFAGFALGSATRQYAALREAERQRPAGEAPDDAA
ncbi:hypothetical protein [Curtobacterium sp. 20TX0008]|uniref:hypothetical protein n=1 Tax=Curtobacterium sp. 20TX0008 TaxID=3022018 RepID=UPI00232BCB9D|nr:hypothetical protein [Curtobacterium sp. 20TX0008]MDB6425850.1 hypothetical protein [Curtobacterium sp. 20TX0008]